MEAAVAAAAGMEAAGMEAAGMEAAAGCGHGGCCGCGCGHGGACWLRAWRLLWLRLRAWRLLRLRAWWLRAWRRLLAAGMEAAVAAAAGLEAAGQASSGAGQGSARLPLPGSDISQAAEQGRAMRFPLLGSDISQAAKWFRLQCASSAVDSFLTAARFVARSGFLWRAMNFALKDHFWKLLVRTRMGTGSGLQAADEDADEGENADGKKKKPHRAMSLSTVEQAFVLQNHVIYICN